MLLLMFPFMMFLSMYFTRVKHPLAMGLILLIHTCLVCMCCGMESLSYWFSYVLFLVYLGGMMVLFIYVASLAPNELFSTKVKPLFIMVLFIAVVCFFFLDVMEVSFNIYSVNLENSEDINFVKFIYSESVMDFTLFIILYLLLTLLVVVEITGSYFGPLRLMT